MLMKEGEKEEKEEEVEEGIRVLLWSSSKAIYLCSQESSSAKAKEGAERKARVSVRAKKRGEREEKERKEKRQRRPRAKRFRRAAKTGPAMQAIASSRRVSVQCGFFLSLLFVDSLFWALLTSLGPLCSSAQPLTLVQFCLVVVFPFGTPCVFLLSFFISIALSAGHLEMKPKKTKFILFVNTTQH